MKRYVNIVLITLFPQKKKVSHTLEQKALGNLLRQKTKTIIINNDWIIIMIVSNGKVWKFIYEEVNRNEHAV